MNVRQSVLRSRAVHVAISAVALLAGNVAVIPEAGAAPRVKDRTPPVVSLTAPTSGATYTTAQTVSVSASASDNVAMRRVEFYRNGVLQGSDTSAPYSFSWAVTSAVSGSHSWTARAVDASGNAATSAAVTVSVNIAGMADTTSPTVSMTAPASGASYTTAQTVTVSASASDNVGVSRVEFYRNGVLQGTDTVSPYSYAWSVTSANNGTQTWTARAYDTAGNATTSNGVSCTVNISSSDTTAPTVWFTSPAAGSSYSSSQTVTLTASAMDNIAVTGVDFYEGGILRGSDTTAPFTWPWSFSATDTGTHSWTARAYDAAGNVGTSGVLILKINLVSTNWSRQFGGVNAGDIAVGRAVAIDTLGNVVLAASQMGSANYGGAAIVAGPIDQPVLTKYTFAGVPVWSRLFSTTNGGTGLPTAVVTDFDGSAVIVGHFQSTVDFGGGPLTSAGSPDVFVAKYSSAGAHLWSRRFGSTGSDKGLAIAIDGAGAVYVAGLFAGSVDFGSGSPLVSAAGSIFGGSDIFLAKYASNGQHIWSRRFGGTGADAANAVAVDAFGSVVIAGSFEGSATFDASSVTSAGAKDVFLASLASIDGSVTWVRSFGGVSADEGRGVAVTGAGDVVVAANFQGSVTFGGPVLASAGMSDIALAKYTRTGTYLWSQRFGGSYAEAVGGVAVSSSGSIALTGSFVGGLDFGGGPLAENGSWNSFVACFSATGAPSWSRGAGGTWDDQGNGVAISATGDVVATGAFSQSADWGDGNLVNTGGADGYLVQFWP
jgi:hypothetical protein